MLCTHKPSAMAGASIVCSPGSSFLLLAVRLPDVSAHAATIVKNDVIDFFM